MKLNDRKSPRPGFTLIELMVVMAIIAILISLTAAAVMKFLAKGPEVQRRSDISQMADNVVQVRTAKNLDEQLPSRFALRSNISQYTPPTDKLDVDSLLFLKKMFGDRVGYDTSGTPIPLAWLGYDAAGNPILIPDGQRVVLTGDQCLVFFLGGITYGTPPNCQGFCSAAPLGSTIPASRNPTQPGGDRFGPFMKFDSKRLIVGANGFYSYADPYGTPYAYFSSYKTTDGYARYYTLFGNSDCVNLGVSPYQSSANPIKFYNSKSFQIISAGPDRTFGPGGLWASGTASGPTQDDMSNFSDAVLGAQ